MGLQDYKRKRNLDNSGEPEAELYSSEHKLIFVIQKHQASHLHFDLRLEFEGVLKSWAVPKGPSLNPSIKKLAIMVENHPLEYRNFEGIIPKGNYGAGTVMIWDEGTYYIPNAKTKEDSQQIFKHSIDKGHIVFFLEGKKLTGAFNLVKLNKSSLANSWLLIKKQDQYAKNDIIYDDNDRSVRSGRTMNQINICNLPTVESFENSVNTNAHKKTSFPQGPIHPMLAQLTNTPFDHKDWLFEIKWDGYRAIAEIRHNSLQFYSRNGISFLENYIPVVQDLKNINFEAIFDGELVVVDSEGRADFGLLQNYRHTNKGNLLYYIFDLLFFEGCDLRPFPLIQRKTLLKQILPSFNYLRYNNHIENNGVAFYQLAIKNRIEGIIAKDKNSPYLEGTRSGYWKKIKITLQQEFVIGGFSESKGGRTGFGALLLGTYQNDKLVYAGSVGSGFSNDELPLIRGYLEKIITHTNPFASLPHVAGKVLWVYPSIVCEVKFAEWTKEGILRQPVFLGIREDLNPKEVHREYPKESIPQKTLFPGKISEDTHIEIDGRRLKLTNLNKIYFPNDNITKKDIINYYRNISRTILLYLRNRPQSLHRFPDGIFGNNFYQKNIEEPPEWVSSFKVDTTNYILCQDEATLTYIVNLGSIEINPWNSQIESIDFPDFMVIDLDPLECPFQYVIDTALLIHDILQQLNLPHFVKTSGATGLHLYVPVGARYSFEQVRQFSFIICTLVNKKSPSITSIERAPHKRKGRVYLDFLQNSKGKTMAAPYSVRPHNGAPVSAPLLWEELNYDLTPDQFNIHTIFARLNSLGDLWKPTIGSGIDMQFFLNRLATLF